MSLHQVDKVLGKRFVTKDGTKHGVLVLGKQVPFGIGGVIGGAGNAAFARMTICSAQWAFGPTPGQGPEELDGGSLREPRPAASWSQAILEQSVVATHTRRLTPRPRLRQRRGSRSQ